MANQNGRSLSAFAAGEYVVLLKELIALGYTDKPLELIEPDQPHLFIRHDIDICMNRALAMAQSEAEIDVSATYYFLMSSDLYNPASAANKKILREIVSLGHRIGLHFDVTAYHGEVGELELFADQERTQLEKLAAAPVETISFHRPSQEWLNRSGTFAGCRHTYEPAFFRDIAYISDSNGGWHHGHPINHPSVHGRKAIQLLTHPIWWTNEKELSVIETLQAFKSDNEACVEKALQETVTAYKLGV